MPQVKGTKPGEFSECLCAFADRLGDTRQLVTTGISTLVALLTVLKTYLKLLNALDTDQITKVKYQAELTWLQAGTETVMMLPRTIQGVIRSYSDCPPVATFSKTVKKAADEQMKPIYERQFELERLIDSINRKRQKESVIQGWIDWLEAFNESLGVCGED